MNRVMTWTAALTVLVAGFAVIGQSQAEAGLFNRNKCCKQAKKCRTPRRERRNKCCQTACAPAPACVAAAPCETQVASCCPSRRELRKARRCCIQTCGCETAAAPACGACSSCGGAAPAEEAAPEAPAGDATT